MAESERPSNRRLALILGGLAMFGPFSIDTIFPAFPQIAAELGADKVAMQQTISVYLLAYAAMSLVHGPLSDAFGRKRVLVGGLLVYMLASAGCALSSSLPMLLSFRALQGFSAGVGLIVGRAVIRDVLHGHDAQRLMSQVSMIFGIAPALAPVIGGWLLGWQRWPCIFWFLALFAAGLIVVVWRGLPETHPPAARPDTKAPSIIPPIIGMKNQPNCCSPSPSRSSTNAGAEAMYRNSAPKLSAAAIDSRRKRGWRTISE